MIVIIDYGMGNLGSILNMLKRTGVEAVVSSDIAAIKRADKFILPGVGAFDNGMRNLRDRGFMPILHEKVIGDKTPILGICLGMQLFAKGSEEGTLPGLGWIDAETVRFRFTSDNADLKIPHMGWNIVNTKKKSLLFNEMCLEHKFYFVHSYHVVCNDQSDILATTVHGYEFTSAIEHSNIIGVQFHPEKSHKFGMRLFRNFTELY